MKQHPITSLYHLCNDTRIRNQEVDFEEKRNKFKETKIDASINQIDNYFKKRKFKEKFSASKLALTFKKLLKLPRRDPKFNGIWSAQVLPSIDQRCQMEITRKPVPTVLDSEYGMPLANSDETLDLNQLQKIPCGTQDKTKILWHHKKSISDGYQFINLNKITS